jgi:transcriptional regulator with XRE-family HTH domain
VSQREQHDLRILGRAVAEIREQGAMSAERLASAAGVELAQLHALEDGRVDPTYELLLVLAETLGVRASAFVLRAEALAAGERDGGGKSEEG